MASHNEGAFAMMRSRSRSPVFSVVVSACLVVGCEALGRVEPFRAVGDVATTTSRSNAERGFGEQVEAPVGLSWSLAVDGFHAVGAEPPRYEFTIDLRDTLRVRSELPRGTPDFATAELVDDSGLRYVCERGRVPDPDPPRRGDDEDPAEARYTMLFDLPTDYRFASVFSLTVHWRLRLDTGEVLPISSRFRR